MSNEVYPKPPKKMDEIIVPVLSLAAQKALNLDCITRLQVVDPVMGF